MTKGLKGNFSCSSIHEITEMSIENTIKLNWSNLQISFNAAEDTQYLARAWLQQVTVTVLTLVLFPEVLSLENELKNNYSWST